MTRLRAALQLVAWCLVAVIVLQVACSSPPVPGPVPAASQVAADAQLQDARELLEGGAVQRLVRAAGLEEDAPAQHGRFRTFAGKTSCSPAGGVNPYLWPMRREPLAGELVLVDATTRACAPYPEADCWLLIALHPPPAPRSLGDSIKGGWQLVEPDAVVHVAAGQLLTDGLVLHDPATEPGQVHLAWTPPASFVGRSVWLQVLVHAPGENAAGFLVSHGLEIVLGSR